MRRLLLTKVGTIMCCVPFVESRIPPVPPPGYVASIIHMHHQREKERNALRVYPPSLDHGGEKNHPPNGNPSHFWNMF